MGLQGRQWGCKGGQRSNAPVEGGEDVDGSHGPPSPQRRDLERVLEVGLEQTPDLFDAAWSDHHLGLVGGLEVEGEADQLPDRGGRDPRPAIPASPLRT